MRQLFIVFFVLAIITAKGQERKWFEPDFVGVQYAGSIGYISGMAGYRVFKEKARWSFHMGHVPQAQGGPLNIFASKLLFVPKRYTLSDRVIANPFDAGLMISYHLGSDFRSKWPEHRYPENYYWWQTSFRIHALLQSSLTIQLRHHTVFKSTTFYIEANTNELYLVSYIQNSKGLDLIDILKLGAGIRLQF
jgi:hypothetical protein